MTVVVSNTFLCLILHFRIMSRNFVSMNEELQRGDYLLSNNGEWKAVFQVTSTINCIYYKLLLVIQWYTNTSLVCLQEDSNFVIYGWKPVWASDTYGSDAVRLCMQHDGNLVMYNKGDQPRWHTNTVHKCNKCRLTLTNNGKLMLCKDTCNVWNSDQNNGMK